MVPRALVLVIVLVVVPVGLTSGCGKTDHAAIDKWLGTAKGPAKLARALADDSLDADLSAHAAVNLVRRGEDRGVIGALEGMAPGRRAEVIARLAPRVWELARVERETDEANATQVTGKDLLVRLRPWASDAARAQIDGYLLDWFCVPAYKPRALTGAYLGAAVMRMIGPPAAARLARVVNGVIAAPGQAHERNRVSDELLVGLAATGSPDAVKYVLDLVKMDRGDPSQAGRAVSALFVAYVDPNGAFPVADHEALAPHADAIAAIAADDSQPARVANDAVALLRAVGPPRCLAPLVSMIARPHREADWKLVAANNALKCGGVGAIGQVIAALPDGGVYAHDKLTSRISGEIAQMTPRAGAIEAARALLADPSTVARWVGMEALAALKSVEDAPRIAALASRRERLAGYWGEDAAGKPDPTLGERARALSAALAGK